MVDSADERGADRQEVIAARMRDVEKYNQRIRELAENDIAEATEKLHRCKVQVARLVKEQRDLQEKIRGAWGERRRLLKEAGRASKLGDEGVRGESAAAADATRAEIEGMKKELALMKSQAEAVVDEIRRGELAIDRARRAKMMVVTWDLVLDLRGSLVKLESAVELSGVAPPRDKVAELDAALKLLQAQLMSLWEGAEGGSNEGGKAR